MVSLASPRTALPEIVFAVTLTVVSPDFLVVSLIAAGSSVNSSRLANEVSKSHLIEEATTGSESFEPSAALGTLGVTAYSCVPSSNAEYIGEKLMRFASNLPVLPSSLDEQP